MSSIIDVSAARQALDDLDRTDLDTLDRAGLDTAIGHARRIRGLLDALDVGFVRRAQQLAATGVGDPPDSVLADHGRRTAAETRAATGRENVCERMPAFESLLGAGDVSTGHVDALHHASAALDDAHRRRFDDHVEDLARYAASATVDQFARHCRDLARTVAADDGTSRLQQQRRERSWRHRIDGVTGMHLFSLALDPENAGKVLSAVRAQVASIAKRSPNSGQPFEHVQADAAVELLTGARWTGEARVPEIGVQIDLRTLLDGLHEHSICETTDGDQLPVSTVRRLCCDAEIIPIVLGGDGAVLDAGRSIRTANRAQRRALRAMYRTCGHPDCAVPFDHCQIHHVIWWERLGRTDLDNLLPLCSRHHHLVHEGGWTLTLAADRTITLTRPDGVLAFSGITIDAVSRRPPRSGAPPTRRRTAA